MATKFFKTTSETVFEVGALYEFRLVNNGLNAKAFTAVKTAFKMSHGIGSPMMYARMGKWAGKATAVFVEMVKTDSGYDIAKDGDGKALKPIHIALEDLSLGLYVELDGGANYDLPLEYRLVKAAKKPTPKKKALTAKRAVKKTTPKNEEKAAAANDTKKN